MENKLVNDLLLCLNECFKIFLIIFVAGSEIANQREQLSMNFTYIKRANYLLSRYLDKMNKYDILLVYLI